MFPRLIELCILPWESLAENRLFPINRSRWNCTVRSPLRLLLVELQILHSLLCLLSHGRNRNPGYSSGKEGWQPPQKLRCHFSPVAKGCSSVMLPVSSLPNKHIGLVTTPPPQFTAKSLRSCSLRTVRAHKELCNSPIWKIINRLLFFPGGWGIQSSQYLQLTNKCELFAVGNKGVYEPEGL